MMLIVDSNEKATNPKVFQSLERNFSNVIVANLNAGDINIPLDDGSVLAIERKTPNDFLSSIADGRIFEQAECMAQNAKYSAFIVTGYFTYSEKSDMVMIEGEKTNWKGSSVRAVMRVIQYSGCVIEFCPPSRICQIISELYMTVNKPDERRGIQKKRIITFPPVDKRVQFLAQLPGIGLDTAESVLQFAGMMDSNADEYGYGTIAGALEWITIMSGVDKDARPKNWGPNRILNVRKFFGLESSQYIGVSAEEGSNLNDHEEK